MATHILVCFLCPTVYTAYTFTGLALKHLARQSQFQSYTMYDTLGPRLHLGARASYDIAYTLLLYDGEHTVQQKQLR